jgi:hypothetical protein
MAAVTVGTAAASTSPTPERRALPQDITAAPGIRLQPQRINSLPKSHLAPTASRRGRSAPMFTIWRGSYNLKTSTEKTSFSKKQGLLLQETCDKLCYKPIIAKKGSFRKQKNENNT